MRDYITQLAFIEEKYFHVLFQFLQFLTNFCYLLLNTIRFTLWHTKHKAQTFMLTRQDN